MVFITATVKETGRITRINAIAIDYYHYDVVSNGTKLVLHDTSELVIKETPAQIDDMLEGYIRQQRTRTIGPGV